jgi:hypothetical protein
MKNLKETNRNKVLFWLNLEVLNPLYLPPHNTRVKFESAGIQIFGARRLDFFALEAETADNFKVLASLVNG